MGSRPAVQPLHDFVLVERLPDSAPPGILIPESLRNANTGLRIGKVLAIGPGDPARVYECGNPDCSGAPHVISSGKTPTCYWCGSRMFWTRSTRTHPMHVDIGDRVVYPRVPANDIRINGQEYTFLHEEQHILAVLEEANGENAKV